MLFCTVTLEFGRDYRDKLLGNKKTRMPAIWAQTKCMKRDLFLPFRSFGGS